MAAAVITAEIGVNIEKSKKGERSAAETMLDNVVTTTRRVRFCKNLIKVGG